MLNKDAKYIWLTSVPKSGNTWLRAFLTAVLADTDPDLNSLEADLISSNRRIIDETLGINSSDLPERDYLKFRSEMYHKFAKRSPKEYLLCKVHDACTLEGEILFTPGITRGAVYILRNPFDMAASMANHHTIPIAEAVKWLCSNKHTLANKKNKIGVQISQYIGTWSNHVQSWTNVHRNNMLLIKYEDMVNDGLPTFTKVVDYLELHHSQQDIENAIERTSFDKLQDKEKITKVRMAPKVKQFFRAGKVGGWRNEITEDQARLIVDCNYESLLKYNYVDAKGNILV